jgi:hypothetical protein
MSVTYKYWGLCILTLVAVGSLPFFPSIPQAVSYHDYADKRRLWGIPNFGNVVSNVLFLGVGVYGLVSLRRSVKGGTESAIQVRETAKRVPKGLVYLYALLFAGIFLTGVGSAYYHAAPDNDRLVYDRLATILIFMTALAITVAEFMDYAIGTALLAPLLLFGIGSVMWWHFGDQRGEGDLRLYSLVQFYPLVFIPLIVLLFYTPKHRPALLCLLWVIGWYLLAKVFELLDRTIYSWHGVISGHSLKHLAAAVATFYLVKMFRQEYLASESLVV